MIGKTTIILNRETVKLAIQEYLDRQFHSTSEQNVVDVVAQTVSSGSPYTYTDFALKLEIEPRGQEVREEEIAV